MTSKPYTMQREEVHPGNGQPFPGIWVLRSSTDKSVVDYDQYQNDLLERHGRDNIEIPAR